MSKPKPETTANDQAPAAPERVTLHKGADGVAVLASAARFGAVRIGDMLPGVVYVVSPAEAGRLVKCKRFDCVDETQRDAAIAAYDAAMTAAINAHHAAMPAAAAKEN